MCSLTVKVKTILGWGGDCAPSPEIQAEHFLITPPDPGCWTSDRWGLLDPGARRRENNDPFWLEAFSSFPARQEEGQQMFSGHNPHHRFTTQSRLVSSDQKYQPKACSAAAHPDAQRAGAQMRWGVTSSVFLLCARRDCKNQTSLGPTVGNPMSDRPLTQL